MADATPEDTSIQPETRSLPYIPLDVVRKLAKFVDLKSALVLARSCRMLRDAGEIRIYRDIDIGSGWTAEDRMTFPPTDAASTSHRLKAAGDRTQLLLNAFTAYPFRVHCVETCRVEPTDSYSYAPLAEAQVAILRLIACQLRSLAILPLPAVPEEYAQEPSALDDEQFFGALRKLQLPFPQLIQLRYAYPARATYPIDTWMAQMPNLEEIQICSSERLYFSDIQTLPDLPQFHRMRKITIEQVDGPNRGLEILYELLKLAPNVECVQLKGQCLPSKKDAALQALGQAKCLKAIVACSSNESMPFEDRGIEILHLGKVALPSLEEIGVDGPEFREESEQNLYKHILIPKALAIRRLTYFTPSGPFPADYAVAPLGITPPAIGHLSRLFIHRLRRAPLLSSILFLRTDFPFASTYSLDRTEHDLFVDSTQWIALGHRGIVIRQFCGDAGELWHVKVLSRAVAAKTQQTIPHVAIQRYIKEYAQFDGRTVPRSVLQAVYEASEDDKEWMEGGRDMVLGGGSAACWDVLAEWRATIGDASDEEDGFTGVDDEVESGGE